MKNGKIEDITLYSEALNEEMQLLIHLPHNFSTLYKYALLIASDGKDYFQLGRIPRVMDELIANKEIENVITVGIPYKSVSERRRMYHPEGDRHQAYIRFLAHELVPYLDKQYPTYQVGQGRALVGDSLAATISLLTAAKYPNIFGKVILQSPYVDTSVLETVKSIQNPSTLSIYHVIGKKETEVKTTDHAVKDFLMPNRELNKVFQERGFPYFYEELDGDHTWKTWQPDLRRAIRMIYGS